jgi:hypothetical protein
LEEQKIAEKGFQSQVKLPIAKRTKLSGLAASDDVSAEYIKNTTDYQSWNEDCKQSTQSLCAVTYPGKAPSFVVTQDAAPNQCTAENKKQDDRLVRRIHVIEWVRGCRQLRLWIQENCWLGLSPQILEVETEMSAHYDQGGRSPKQIKVRRVNRRFQHFVPDRGWYRIGANCIHLVASSL